MGIGSLGVSELVILAVLVLVFFGPRRIPEVARSVGEALREFRRGVNEIRRELEDVERSVSERGGDGERETPRGRVEPGAWEEGRRDDRHGPERGGPPEPEEGPDGPGSEPEGGDADESGGEPPTR